MTPEIATTLTILGLAVLLFVTERIRVDVVALMVMVSLALSGLVSPAEALSGFSNLAVVTVWAVLILSAGLSRTGVADIVGRQVLRLAGASEARLTLVIMLTVGVLSAFMNNIGAVALMLPVVVDVARRTRHAPSKLLMPLAFAALLGGLTTLIGTPPNILISEALRGYGLTPFQMFDYAPLGTAITLSGIAVMVVIGRRLLPQRDIARETSGVQEAVLGQVYDFRERLYRARLRPGSSLGGKTLAESRLGSAVDLNVVAIERNGRRELAPEPTTTLRQGDAILVVGRLDRLDELRGRRHLVLADESIELDQLMSEEIELVEARISEQSALIGATVLERDFRRLFGVIVIAIVRNERAILKNVDDLALEAGDLLLIQIPRVQLEIFQQQTDFDSCVPTKVENLRQIYRLHEHLITLEVPEDSLLVGKTLAESRMGTVFALAILGIVRDRQVELMPNPFVPLRAGDRLIAKGEPQELETLRGLQELEIDADAGLELHSLQSDSVGLVEVILAPHSPLEGKTLRQMQFREKYGLNVIAIWRRGRAIRSNLTDRALQFGDALLVYGRRDKFALLGRDPDFLVLSEAAQEPPLVKKAPIALAIMVGVLLPVIFGWVSIAIAAVVGVVLMVLTGCLSMEEAYRAIEWKAIFLIAGMLPLGIAMDRTGTTQFLADAVVGSLGDLGPVPVMGGLFLLATLSSQVMPNPAVAVLLAPIAFNTAADLGVSPYPFMMTVAVAASAAFLSPVGHPANVMVMGPGGYRFSDYLRVGIPLTLVTLAVTLLVLPRLWPLQP